MQSPGSFKLHPVFKPSGLRRAMIADDIRPLAVKTKTSAKPNVIQNSNKSPEWLSGIHQLPAEIIREIFLRVVYGGVAINSWPITWQRRALIHTCSRWRQIALETAQLWTSICMVSSEISQNFSKQEQWLYLSKDALLDVQIVGPSEFHDSADFILNHMTRCASLLITGPSNFARRAVVMNTIYPYLRFVDDRFRSIDSTLDLLQRAPNLVEMEIHNTWVRGESLGYYSAIRINTLRKITVNGSQALIFEHLTLPSLEEFFITRVHNLQSHIMTDFLSRSKCPLRRLSIDHHLDINLITWFTLCNDIEWLCLRGRAANLSADLIRRLTRITDWNGNEGPACLLPYLTSLDLFIKGDGNLHEWSVYSMIESRCGASNANKRHPHLQCLNLTFSEVPKAFRPWGIPTEFSGLIYKSKYQRTPGRLPEEIGT